MRRQKSPEPTSAAETKPKGNTGKTLKVIFIALIVVIAVVLILQNLAPAPINLLFWKVSLPVIAIMLIFGLLGFLLGFLVFSLAFRKPPSRKKGKGTDDDGSIDIDGQI